MSVGRPQRKLAAILAADMVGYSRLVRANEDHILARWRVLRNDLFDSAIAVHQGRVVKRTGDGVIVEFRSAVDAVLCAIEIQSAMVERNSGFADEDRIIFRIGVHVGDVVEEADGDLMGDGVNIAARLEGIAQPGAICLSEDAYRQVKARVESLANDLGPTQLKNIAEPVRVYSLEVSRPIQNPARSAPIPQKIAPPRLSMVVLPFANIGGDPQQEYFVDGVTESLTTDLSRIRGTLVIGRNTAFTYKGKAVDLKQIGRELNVRYILEGSVQRGNGLMRMNVQLIDAESGIHLWAERFDKPLADLFDMQDEIVARVAGQLGAQLVAAEARRSAIAPSPDSMDLYFQGMSELNKGVVTLEHLKRTRSLFERSLALDVGNIEAMVGAALVDVFVAGNFTADGQSERALAAESVLNRVLSVAPEHALARAWLGRLQIGINRALEGMAECERALTLDRNLASAHAFIGLAKSAIGRAEETAAHVQDALRLSPRDTYAYRWLIIAGFAELSLGRDDEAAAWLRRSIENNRNASVAHFALGAALALLDRPQESRSAVRAGLELDPTFTIHRFRLGAASDHPVFLARRERVYSGMRKAGIPEE